MKRIVTIITISVSLSVTISAQDRTPMDKIWEDIEKIISNRHDLPSFCYLGGLI